MADGLVVATTLLALISTTATLSVTLSKLVTNVRGAVDKFERLMIEIVVLRDVVYECHEILDRVEAPRHVRESLISCFELGREVEQQAHNASEGINSGRHHLKVAIRLVLHDDKLTKAAAVFRERVVLLRDMCSESVIPSIRVIKVSILKTSCFIG